MAEMTSIELIGNQAVTTYDDGSTAVTGQYDPATDTMTTQTNGYTVATQMHYPFDQTVTKDD